jgi:hypothetical protein
MIAIVDWVPKALGADREPNIQRRIAGCAVTRDILSCGKKICSSARDVYKILRKIQLFVGFAAIPWSHTVSSSTLRHQESTSRVTASTHSSTTPSPSQDYNEVGHETSRKTQAS